MLNFFTSERVDDEIDLPKVLIGSFNQDEILASLPFSDRVYVHVCRKCVTGSNFECYKTLLERSAIVPILMSGYHTYPEGVAELTSRHDHLNVYEYQNYRALIVRSLHNGGLCGHCAGELEKSVLLELSEHRELPFKPSDIDRAVQLLYPFVRPDFSLLEGLRDAIGSSDAGKAAQLLEMCETVSELRSAEALEAPFTINARSYEELPRGISESVDTAISTAEAARRQIADGVGLSIPRDIPLEAYLEIANDFRPKLQDLTSRLTRDKGENPIDQLSVQREVMKLNAEIERVKNSPESIFLEAGIEFYQKNSLVLNAALTVSALSLVHGAGWLGCSAGAVTSAAASGLRKAGALKGGPAIKRMARVIETQIQPAVDTLVAKYVGASKLSVRVMSLQRSVGRAAEARRVPAARLHAQPGGKKKRSQTTES